MTQRAKRCEQATRLCVAPEHCSAGFVQNLALHFLAQRNLWIATFTLVSQPPRAGLCNALQPVATPTQAVNQIARDLYGGLEGMFERHGWTTDGRVISQIAPTKVVQTYGSVEGFVRAHEHGVDGNPTLDPKAAILSDPPEV